MGSEPGGGGRHGSKVARVRRGRNTEHGVPSAYARASSGRGDGGLTVSNLFKGCATATRGRREQEVEGGGVMESPTMKQHPKRGDGGGGGGQRRATGCDAKGR